MSEENSEIDNFQETKPARSSATFGDAIAAEYAKGDTKLRGADVKGALEEARSGERPSLSLDMLAKTLPGSTSPGESIPGPHKELLSEIAEITKTNQDLDDVDITRLIKEADKKS